MTEPTATELLDRVVDAGGVLLRVECLLPDGLDAAAMLFTFDVGRLLVSVRPETRGIAALSLEKPEEVPGGLQDTGQEEPWWRILGNALCGVESRGSDGLRLQFRKTEERTLQQKTPRVEPSWST